MKFNNLNINTIKRTGNIHEKISYELMVQANLILRSNNGIFTWLPLGQRIIKNIENLIHKYMAKIDFMLVDFPTLQNYEFWQESKRDNNYGQEMLKIKDRHDKTLVYAPTAEEEFFFMAKNSIKSYRDLPIKTYQINKKFRDEINPKNGVLRGREFLMKDGYSVDQDCGKAITTYIDNYNMYSFFLNELNVPYSTLKSDCGEIGGDLSHEFFMGTGDNIIEIGHIFYFSDLYSKNTKLFYLKDNKKIYPYGGCYGIGVSRIVAAIIESSHDKNGIIWPPSISPFKFHLVSYNNCTIGEEIYCFLNKDVLWDDRDNKQIGHKINDSLLLGISYIIIVRKDKTIRFIIRQNNRTFDFKTINNFYQFLNNFFLKYF